MPARGREGRGTVGPAVADGRGRCLRGRGRRLQARGRRKTAVDGRAVRPVDGQADLRQRQGPRADHPVGGRASGVGAGPAERGARVWPARAGQTAAVVRHLVGRRRGPQEHPGVLRVFGAKAPTETTGVLGASRHV